MRAAQALPEELPGLHHVGGEARPPRYLRLALDPAQRPAHHAQLRHHDCLLTRSACCRAPLSVRLPAPPGPGRVRKFVILNAGSGYRFGCGPLAPHSAEESWGGVLVVSRAPPPPPRL